MFKDNTGEIIYVGKALSLRNRVRSYFHQGRNLTRKGLAMVDQIDDVEYITTDSEVEALILESNLVKKHRPKYNVRLKDDKHYPYIKVTTSEEYPQVTIARSVENKTDRFFGPYTRSGAVSETLRVLRRIFPFRTCTNSKFGRVTRPCLDYHIKRCLGPCHARCSPQEYQEITEGLIMFLEGKQEDLLKRMKERMSDAADNLRFEEAAELRDQIGAMGEVIARQKIISSRGDDSDILAVARHEDEACVQVFFLRGGKLFGRDQFFLEGSSDQTDGQVLTAFIKQHYDDAIFIPREILVQFPIEDHAVIEEWLSDKRGFRVTVHHPQRGEKRRLVEMVARNAALAVEENYLRKERQERRAQEGLEQLQEQLNLAEFPYRIECYDISNIQGTGAVGSMVVFEDGHPASDQYRKFQIRTVEGPNDFAMMQEVLYRRFKRAQSEGEHESSFGTTPQLVIVDGGKGQLSAAVEVLEHLGFSDVPLFGLAKREEEVFAPRRSDPVILPPDSPGLHLLQQIRDEAHRFAVTYHRKVRKRSTLQSVLDDIPGIGPKRRTALLRHFKSVDGIREKTVEELAAVPGMTRAAAASVHKHLRDH